MFTAILVSSCRSYECRLPRSPALSSVERHYRHSDRTGVPTIHQSLPRMSIEDSVAETQFGATKENLCHILNNTFILLMTLLDGIYACKIKEKQSASTKILMSYKLHGYCMQYDSYVRIADVLAINASTLLRAFESGCP